MSLLTKVSKSSGVRFLSSIGSAAQPTKHLQTEKLNKRSLVRVSGKDAVPFLQGLVTNDVEHLWHGSPAIYSMFLNKGGRVLYDSIIYRSPHENTYFIECDESVDRDLAKHLKLFRVRRKISVDAVSSEYVVWVVHDRAEMLNPAGEKIAPTTLEPGNNKDVIVSHDPRLKLLGTRLVVPHDYNIYDINKYFPENELQPAEPENDYTTLRYKLGIGEGIVDHPPTKAFPMETNCDYLHGISFHKGCYLGQELTARTYHTGVIRKRIMPLQVSDKVIAIDENANVQTLSGTNVGKLRGHKSGYGLALMRIEQALDAPSLLLNGAVCTVKKPFWWPGALPTREEIAGEKQK